MKKVSKKITKKRLIIAVILTILIVVAGVACFFINKNINEARLLEKLEAEYNLTKEQVDQKKKEVLNGSRELSTQKIIGNSRDVNNLANSLCKDEALKNKYFNECDNQKKQFNKVARKMVDLASFIDEENSVAKILEQVLIKTKEAGDEDVLLSKPFWEEAKKKLSEKKVQHLPTDFRNKLIGSIDKIINQLDIVAKALDNYADPAKDLEKLKELYKELAKVGIDNNNKLAVLLNELQAN